MDQMTETLTFGWLDWGIIGAYLVMLMGVGTYFSCRQDTIKEYFLASKHMSWIPIGMSLLAALNSGIDYMAQPSAFIKYNICIVLMCASWFLIYPYAFFVTMPMYRRMDIYSAYEYLEERFNVAVRCLAAVIFLMWRLGWMATALYVPCLAFHTVTGGQLPLKPTILVLGMVATIYTMLGGVKAVIWTEVVQFVVMFGGLLLTMVIIFANVEIDLGSLWEAVGKEGQGPIASPDQYAGPMSSLIDLFRTPVTWYGVFIAAIVGRFAGYTSDQVMVQRFQTSRSIKDVRQGFLITAISDTVWMLTLIFVGVILFLYFQDRTVPDWVANNTDYYFPYFMSKVFPSGTTGPVIAAIIAASLSAIASAINSQSTVIIVDFYNRIVKNRKRPPQDLSPEEQRFQLKLSRIAAVAAGVAGTLLACELNRLGTIFEIGGKIIQTFTGPMLAIFWLGMFTKRANSWGTFLAGVVGTLVGVYVALGTDVSFLWPAVFAFASTMVVGCLTGYCAKPNEKNKNWTWFAIMRKELME